MKKLCKILIYTLILSLVLTGCGTGKSENESSAPVFSDISDVISETASLEASSEDGSQPVSSEEASSEESRIIYADVTEYAKSKEAVSYVCSLGSFLGITDIPSAENADTYQFAVYSALMLLGEDAFEGDCYNCPIDSEKHKEYMLTHFGNSEFEVDGYLLWLDKESNSPMLVFNRSIEMEEYGMQIACGYSAEVIGVNVYSEKVTYTVSLKSRFYGDRLTAIAKMNFEAHTDEEGYYYLKLLSVNTVVNPYTDTNLQSDSSKQSAYAMLMTATDKLTDCFENGRIKIEATYGQSQLKINYMSANPLRTALLDNIAKKGCAKIRSDLKPNDYYLYDCKEYFYSDLLGLNIYYDEGDYSTAVDRFLANSRSYCKPTFEGISAKDITVLSDTEDTLIIQTPYYDYDTCLNTRTVYAVSPENRDELLADSVSTVTIDKKSGNITRYVLTFELTEAVHKLHNFEKYRYNCIVCDYGYDNIDLSDMELPKSE